MHVENIGAGVLLIHDFLTAAECQALISHSDNMQYEEAAISTTDGDKLLKEVRNNDRIIFDDAVLSQSLYEKAKAHLPDQPANGWYLQGFNERLRFYRYTAEQFFKWHKDGTYQRSAQEESFLSFIIYLNDDYTGGCTEFKWESIQPKTGMALVFPHKLTHQGAAITTGIKYVLRTDVMYRHHSYKIVAD